MSAAVLAGPDSADCHWVLDLFQRSPTQVEIAYDADDVHIRVTDTVTTRGAPTSVTHATLSTDGTVRLGVHGAPPGLLLSPQGARLIPCLPDVDEVAVMADGDLLVLCCAGMLEQLPAGFRTVVDDANAGAVADLVAALRHLSNNGAGGAVVATRRPADARRGAS